MSRGRRLAILVALCTGLWAVAAAILPARAATASEQDELKARLSRETDPVKRSKMEVRLAEIDLDAATQLYGQGSFDQGLEKIQSMLGYIEQAHNDLFNTGRDPRKKPKGFKETEIKLREFHRRLEDLRLTIPLEDRAPVDKVLARVVEIHDHFLNGLMRVKGGKES